MNMSQLNNNTATMDDILDAINNLPGAGSVLDTSDATATAADILKDETAYANGVKITGTIETKSSSDLTSSGATVNVPAGYYANNTSKSVNTVDQATPSISVSNSGLITASVTQTEGGYVPADTTTTATEQLDTKGATTYTPSASNQTIIASGTYLTGKQTIKGDSNLVPSNIKNGVTIFGVKGSLTDSNPVLQSKTVTPSASSQTITANSGYDGLSQVTIEGDSDLIASNIKNGVTIFGVKGSLTDSNPVLQSKTVTPSISSQTITADSGYDGLSQVTIEGDSDLIPDCIKSGVSIFGVNGSFTSRATATAADILEGATAYVDGVEIVGTYRSLSGTIHFWEIYSDEPYTYTTEWITDLVISRDASSYDTNDTWDYIKIIDDFDNFTVYKDGSFDTGPTTSVRITSTSDAEELIKNGGKYIHMGNSSFVYYIPSDATFSLVTNYIANTNIPLSREIVASDARKFITTKPIGYIASHNDDTFPVPEGHHDSSVVWYEYKGSYNIEYNYSKETYSFDKV